MARAIKLSAGLLVLACAVIAVMSFQASLGKIFTLDETHPVTRAHMMISDGLEGPRKALGDEAFTHPPLYEAVLVGVFRVFGESEVSARSVGIVAYILVGVLLLGLLKILSCDSASRSAGFSQFIFVCMYLTSPLVIQHSMLIDSETALIFPIATAFIVLFIAADRWVGRRYWMSRLGLGGLFALAFFAKEVTPFLLVGGVVIYRIVAGEWKKIWQDLLGILVFGAMLIGLGFTAFSIFTGHNMEIFLAKQYGFRTQRVLSVEFFTRVFKNISVIVRWPVFWGTLPLHLLALYGLGARLKSRFWDRKGSIEDFLWISILVVWVPYLLVKPSIDMMKFQHTAYPWIMVGVALVIARLNLSWRWWSILGACVVSGLVCVHYYKAGDYILSLSLPQKSKIWMDFLTYYSMPVIAGTLASWILFFKARKAAVLIFLWVMTLSIGIALDWRQKEASYTTVESWLNYGEKGMRETIDFLKTKKLQGRMISTRSDIDYYLRRREGIELSSNIEISTLFSLQNPQDRIKLIQRRALDYIVIDNVSRVYVRMNTPIGDLIQKNYRVEKQMGDFQILSPRRSSGVR